MKGETREEADRFGLCPYVTAQQLLSGKWAILILHALEGSPKRFGQIQREIGATQATLATHLRSLEEEGLLTRTVYPEVPPRVKYELTDIGREFRPVLASIQEWGTKYIEYLNGKSANKGE